MPYQLAGKRRKSSRNVKRGSSKCNRKTTKRSCKRSSKGSRKCSWVKRNSKGKNKRNSKAYCRRMSGGAGKAAGTSKTTKGTSLATEENLTGNIVGSCGTTCSVGDSNPLANKDKKEAAPAPAAEEKKEEAAPAPAAEVKDAFVDIEPFKQSDDTNFYTGMVYDHTAKGYYNENNKVFLAGFNHASWKDPNKGRKDDEGQEKMNNRWIIAAKQSDFFTNIDCRPLVAFNFESLFGTMFFVYKYFECLDGLQFEYPPEKPPEAPSEAPTKEQIEAQIEKVKGIATRKMTQFNDDDYIKGYIKQIVINVAKGDVTAATANAVELEKHYGKTYLNEGLMVINETLVEHVFNEYIKTNYSKLVSEVWQELLKNLGEELITVGWWPKEYSEEDLVGLDQHHKDNITSITRKFPAALFYEAQNTIVCKKYIKAMSDQAKVDVEKLARRYRPESDAEEAGEKAEKRAEKDAEKLVDKLAKETVNKLKVVAVSGATATPHPYHSLNPAAAHPPLFNGDGTINNDILVCRDPQEGPRQYKAVNNCGQKGLYKSQPNGSWKLKSVMNPIYNTGGDHLLNIFNKMVENVQPATQTIIFAICEAAGLVNKDIPKNIKGYAHSQIFIDTKDQKTGGSSGMMAFVVYSKNQLDKSGMWRLRDNLPKSFKEDKANPVPNDPVTFHKLFTRSESELTLDNNLTPSFDLKVEPKEFGSDEKIYTSLHDIDIFKFDNNLYINIHGSSSGIGGIITDVTNLITNINQNNPDYNIFIVGDFNLSESKSKKNYETNKNDFTELFPLSNIFGYKIYKNRSGNMAYNNQLYKYGIVFEVDTYWIGVMLKQLSGGRRRIKCSGKQKRRSCRRSKRCSWVKKSKRGSRGHCRKRGSNRRSKSRTRRRSKSRSRRRSKSRSRRRSKSRTRRRSKNRSRRR